MLTRLAGSSVYLFPSEEGASPYQKITLRGSPGAYGGIIPCLRWFEARTGETRAYLVRLNRNNDETLTAALRVVAGHEKRSAMSES